MIRTRGACAIALLLVVESFGASACHDTPAQTSAMPVTGASELRPTITLVEQHGDTMTIALGLAVGAKVGRIGSYTARLVFDEKGTTFVDAHNAAGGAWVVNPTRGLVRMAGTALEGISAGTLVTARFRGSAPFSASTFDLQFDELHEVRHVDRRTSVRATSVETKP